jgi:hypothetical protein
MKFSLFIGLATTAVGSWVLSHGHALDSTCNAQAHQLGIAAAGVGCPRAVSTYLMGAALTTGGLIVLALVLFVRVSNSRANVWSAKSFTVAGQPNHTIGTVSQQRSTIYDRAGVPQGTTTTP